MDAHVICCNDRIETVVLEDEARAQTILEGLRDRHYEQRRWQHPNFEHYRRIFFWHIHSVTVTE